MNYSPTHLRELLANPAWKEIAERIQVEEASADEQMESDVEYMRTIAIGKRKVLRMFLALPEQLKKELDAERVI